MLIYLFGFIGLVSIGLLPLRSWHLLRNLFGRGALHAPNTMWAIFAVLIVIIAIWSDVQITVRIFRCLTETYCGPSVASGWIYLATLGVVYVLFEGLFFVLQKINRKRMP